MFYLSHSSVQRTKDPRVKILQLASQFSPSYWHLRKAGFGDTVNFVFIGIQTVSSYKIARMFSFLVWTLLLEKETNKKFTVAGILL